jgi:drug/metabolite transporter (DMT)-like permease
VSRKGWVLFATMCVVWGIPYLLIKVAVGGVGVPVVVFGRTAVGALLLLPFALRSGQLAALRRHWRPLVAFTALEMIGPWGLLSQAERKLPSSLAGLLIAAVPILGVVIARLTGGTERLSSRRWTGLLVGLAGVVVLAAPYLSSGSIWPVGEVLLVALGYASAPLIAARKLADVPALPMTTACLTLAALVYAPAAILDWPHRVPHASVLAALATLGVVCTATAFLVFVALIREIGTTRTMVFTYINPAVAVAAGVAVLGEPFTVTIAASFALIIAGSVLATGSRRDQPPGDQPPGEQQPPPLVEPSPVKPSPVKPSPVKPSPVKPSPVKPSLVEPSPVPADQP